MFSTGLIDHNTVAINIINNYRELGYSTQNVTKDKICHAGLIQKLLLRNYNLLIIILPQRDDPKAEDFERLQKFDIEIRYGWPKCQNLKSMKIKCQL